MVDWGREKYMKHVLKENNPSLVLARQTTDEYWNNIQVTNNMVDNRYHFSYKGIPSQFPLYLYPDTTGQQDAFSEQAERVPNLNMEIVSKMAEGLGLKFVAEKDGLETLRGLMAPIDILDYIYAVLHSPNYREKYKEFLKIDFPRVPYPKDQKTFFELVELGGQLREIHLLESPVVEKFITQYPEDGDNVVVKPQYKDGKVYINDTQYFANVPEVAWNFYIGGYQPAQKWLKDRKDRELSYEDILHYQKIIVALKETDGIMGRIDGVLEV
nr:type ISP restriction/modification enzyme [Flavobacterium piscinae]